MPETQTKELADAVERLEPCPFCGSRLTKSEALSTRRHPAFVHPWDEEADAQCLMARGFYASIGAANKALSAARASAYSALRQARTQDEKTALHWALVYIDSAIDGLGKHCRPPSSGAPS